MSDGIVATMEHRVKYDTLVFDFMLNELHLVRDKKLVCTLGLPLIQPGQKLTIANLDGFATFNTPMQGMENRG